MATPTRYSFFCMAVERPQLHSQLPHPMRASKVPMIVLSASHFNGRGNAWSGCVATPDCKGEAYKATFGRTSLQHSRSQVAGQQCLAPVRHMQCSPG
eukprot:276896-Amphidinium_carterae.2